MITAGLKQTPNGGLALIRDDRLELYVHRRAGLPDLTDIPRLLARHHQDVDDIDGWAVDGRDGGGGATTGTGPALEVAGYREFGADTDPGRPGHRGNVDLGGKTKSYASYTHLAGLVAAAYVTSPFARRREAAAVLVRDGAGFPRLYPVDAAGRISAGRDLFPLAGSVYARADRHFGTAEHAAGDDLTAAARVTDLAGRGTATGDLMAVLREAFDEHFDGDGPAASEYRRAVTGCGDDTALLDRHVTAFFSDVRRRTRPWASNADLAATLRDVLAQVSAERLADRLGERGTTPANLCVTGDGALIPAWNTAMLDHPAVRELWIPPFPDGSGSPVGVAALHHTHGAGLRAMDWSLAGGPEPARAAHLPSGWSVLPCRPEELARLLVRSGRPVAVLTGRAKLGSRPLGGRSVLATATDPATRARLNRIVGREAHRTLVPICLANRVGDVFEPGIRDPYQLYRHRLRSQWTDRLPAVDPDGPVQTVDRADDRTLATIIREHDKWTGIPVLCTAPAEDAGLDHLADVPSALRWGGVDLVWSDNILYRRTSGADRPNRDQEPAR
jgi:carbamoyltransferase